MNYIVEKEDIGKRLDIYLSEKNEEITRSYIKNLIDDGKILVNGKNVKSGYKVKLGDNIDVEIVEKQAENIVAEDIPLDIVFEDEDIIIINKAKGMVVHPANGKWLIL